MPTVFPGGLDNFQNPTPGDNLNTPAVLHSDQHSNENDAVEAIEAWVGISGTSAQASHEYRIKQLENTPPGATAFGVVGWDEGIPLGTGTVLNFVGDNVEATISGTVIRVFVTGSSGNQVIVFPQDNIGIFGKDEGQSLGTGTILNVVGNNLSMSLSGTTLTIEHTDTPVVFPQEVIGIFGQDEGVNLGTGTVLNVTGDNVSLSLSGSVLNLHHTNPSISFPQEIIGVMGQDEGIGLGTGTTLNVTGDNLSLSLSGSVLNLHHTNPAISFPQELIGVYGLDDGIPLGTGTWIDFGDNLTATLSGTVLRVNGQAGGGGGGQFGVVGWDEGRFIGTGSILNVTETDLNFSRSGTVLELGRTTGTTIYLGVNGSRLFTYTASGTWLIFSNTQDPQELIGVYNLSNGIPVGTGSMGTGTWIDWGNNLSVSMSGTTLRVNVNSPVFPQEVIGVMGQNQGRPLGTGTTLNINGSRLVATLSGTVLQISNSPDPAELIGFLGVNKSVSIGTGTTLNVSGTRIQLTRNGDVLELTNSPDPVELIGVMNWKNGAPLGTGTVIDWGDNLTPSMSGTVLRVDASASQGTPFNGVDQIGIYGHDEGVPVGTGTILNVTGGRAVLSRSGTVLNLDISPEPIDNIGIMVQDNGIPVGTGATFNVVGSYTVSGSVSQLRVPKVYQFVAPGAGVEAAYPNLPAADTRWPGANVYADLVGYSEARLSGWFGGVAPATTTGTRVHMKFTSDLASPSYLEIASTPQPQGVMSWRQSTYQTTGWFPIVTGAAIDPVGLALFTTGGNGTADPTYGVILAEFR